MNFKNLTTGLFITTMVTATSITAFASSSVSPEIITASTLKSAEVISNKGELENKDLENMTISITKLDAASNDITVEFSETKMSTGLFIDGKELTIKELADGFLKDETKVKGLKDKNGKSLKVNIDENGFTEITDENGNAVNGIISNVFMATEIKDVNTVDSNLKLEKIVK